MLWRRRKEPQEPKFYPSGVVQEAERLLAGRTLEPFGLRRRILPAWSLVAMLAHASRSDLMRFSTPRSGPDPSGWSATIAYLSTELLSLAYDESSLLRIQRQALIPLELQLLGGATASPGTPAGLVNLVAGVLDRPLFL